MKAKYDDDCALCPDRIIAGMHDVVPHNGGFIHRSCAPGGDDVSQPAARKAAPAKKAAAEKAAPAVPHVEPADTSGTVTEIPPIPASGLLLHNLDEPTYHAHDGSVSQSGLKTIRVAPALFKHERENPVKRAEFDYGSAAHLYVLGTGPEVVELQRTYPDGTHEVAEDKRSPSVALHAEAIRAAGKLPLMAKDHARVKAMAEQIKAHPFAMKLLEKGESEVSAFMVDPDTGVMRRGRADHLRKRVIVDYKSAADANPAKLGKVSHDNGWYMQAPFYKRLFTDVTGVDIDDFVFIVQQKTAPYLVSVVRVESKAMDLGERHCAEAMQRYRDCVESGVWPGYQADGTVTTLQLPRYAYDGVVQVTR